MEGVEGYKILRDQLASSTYLRDSATTRYLNLYDWNDASVDRGDSSSTDRVRMVEQLIQDTHWAKINSVFAAGQGNVTMAFIKDDIGNWNLKSFDNDPTELLDAYKKAGLAAINGITRVVKAISTSGASELAHHVSKAEKLVNFSDKITLGADPNATGLRTSIDNHRESLKTHLDQINGAYGTRLGEINKQLIIGKQNVENNNLKGKDKELDGKRKILDAAKNKNNKSRN